MRDLLTGIAIILIVALSTLLVAPYFVDWNGQRVLLEHQLSRALGQKVTIGGDIDLKLLPTPYLRLNQTVIGSDEGAVRVGIRHLDLELAVAPLLYGEFDIIEGRLDEPTIRITLQPDRTLPLLPNTPALRADVRLERITMTDGTLAVADPESGRTFTLDHLDLTADAPALAGPYKASGSTGSAAERTRFRFSTTAATKGTTHLRLALDANAAHPAVDVDGDVTLKTVGDSVSERFDGSVTASGAVTAAARASTAWQLGGTLKLDPRHFAFSNGQLRIGDADAGLLLKAQGEGDFADRSDVQFDLSAQELDIDRLAGAPVDAATPAPPPQLPPLDDLRKLAAAVTPPFPVQVGVRVDTATWGGEPLSDIAAQFTVGRNTPQPFSLSGRGPGGLHLSTEGTLAPTSSYRGTFTLAADDIPAAARWLHAVAPDLVPQLRTIPVHSASLAGRLQPGPGDTQDVADLALSLDGSALSGHMRIQPSRSTSETPARVTAELAAKTISLDRLPSLRTIRPGVLPFDLSLDLAAGQIQVAQVGDGPLRTGRVHLAMDLSRQSLAVTDFTASDVDGAAIAATAKVNGGTVRFAATVDAAHLERLASLSQQLLPARASDALRLRAAALSPATVKISGIVPTGSTSAAGEQLRLAASGTLGATRVVLALDPGGPQPTDTTLTATAEASDGRALLHQIGVSGRLDRPVGAGRISFKGSGPLHGLLDSRVQASFGTTDLQLFGRFDLFGTGHGGSGTAKLAGVDAAPLLQALALAPPTGLPSALPLQLDAAIAVSQTGIALNDLHGTIGAAAVGGTLLWTPPHGEAPSVTGTVTVDHLRLVDVLDFELGTAGSATRDGNWSGEPFGATLVEPPRVAVKVEAKTLDLGYGLEGHDAAFDLAVSPSVLTVNRAAINVGGGRLGAEMVLRRDGGQAAVEASLDAHAVDLRLPAIKAKLDGKLELAGSGRSVAALVASLAGSGQIHAGEETVLGLAPDSLARVFKDVEGDTLAVDDESISRAFGDVPRSELALGSRSYGTSLAGGVLAALPQDAPLRSGPATLSLSGTLDLRRTLLGLRLIETLRTLPQNWKGPPPAVTVVEAGPPQQTQRSLDASAFTNAVAARAIARETARIESFEFDMRERAFFNARLAADRRREQERKAEADAKAAADAARRAAADAARKADIERRSDIDRQKADADRQFDAKRKTDPSNRPGDGTASPADASRDLPTPDR